MLDSFSSANPTGLQLDAFQHFYNNQAELPTYYKMAYITMMKVDLENRRLMNEFEKDVTNVLRHLHCLLPKNKSGRPSNL